MIGRIFSNLRKIASHGRVAHNARFGRKLNYFSTIPHRASVQGRGAGRGRPATGKEYALEKLYFFGIIKNEPKLDGVASFNYGVPMATFQLHHQTLITIEYQSTRQDESNEPKLDGVASFNYGVPMATFQLHHQTLVTI
ncbi:hypothetical protein EVAR_64059_1 [Eumeta japonica]|uniref:Uncharacterized protein n=1 Tax=Eumeta variegata TaxID=151549 RepID=A0A4C1ZW98_EUMVA|nr:hypothetical protein EVAR_64059_1 [Eumeta japonica]